jgi:hypothetical protein
VLVTDIPPRVPSATVQRVLGEYGDLVAFQFVEAQTIGDFVSPAVAFVTYVTRRAAAEAVQLLHARYTFRHGQPQVSVQFANPPPPLGTRSGLVQSVFGPAATWYGDLRHTLRACLSPAVCGGHRQSRHRSVPLLPWPIRRSQGAATCWPLQDASSTCAGLGGTGASALQITAACTRGTRCLRQGAPGQAEPCSQEGTSAAHARGHSECTSTR